MQSFLKGKNPAPDPTSALGKVPVRRMTVSLRGRSGGGHVFLIMFRCQSVQMLPNR